MYFSQCSAEIKNTIAAFNGNAGIRCFNADLEIVCTDLFGGPYEWNDPDCLTGQEDINGNFSLDPLFCDREERDYRLRSDSPCAPGNNAECGLVGAWPVGCSPPTATAPATWGRIKRLFR
jgi:hypothetical protein